MRAIIPAYNEALTIAGVVEPLLRAGCFDEVIVVDDGSTDRTSAVAHQAGATVVRTPSNRGKGGAMLFGVRQCCDSDEDVAFFDADLIGLRPEHAHRLLDGAAQGYDMVCGLRDKGSVQNILQLGFSPVITGERVLRRWVLDELPMSCWSGFSIETAMNDVVHRHGGKTALVFLPGVSMRTKSQKTGLVRGLSDHWRMARQIIQTRHALRRSGGGTCQLP